MRPYETMVIFDAGAEPSAIQAVIERTQEVISANGGTPGTVDRWGRRPFAYEVRHKREGYYVRIELTGEPATVAELDRLLSLADEVIRHKVIRLPDKPVRRMSGPPSIEGPGRGPQGGSRGGDRPPRGGDRGPRGGDRPPRTAERPPRGVDGPAVGSPAAAGTPGADSPAAGSPAAGSPAAGSPAAGSPVAGSPDPS